jgi:hypothetical protein
MESGIGLAETGGDDPGHPVHGLLGMLTRGGHGDGIANPGAESGQAHRRVGRHGFPPGNGHGEIAQAREFTLELRGKVCHLSGGAGVQAGLVDQRDLAGHRARRVGAGSARRLGIVRGGGCLRDGVRPQDLFDLGFQRPTGLGEDGIQFGPTRSRDAGGEGALDEGRGGQPDRGIRVTEELERHLGAQHGGAEVSQDHHSVPGIGPDLAQQLLAR